MIESIDDKKGLINSHGTDTEKTVPTNRYQTVYPGTIDNFGKQLLGRLLTLELTNNRMMTGRLKSFGQFDIILTDQKTGQDILIFKHAIVTVQGDLSPKK